MPKQLQEDELFNESHAVKSNWVKWGKVGDWFKGTLTDKRQVKSTLPGQEDKMVMIYDFLAKGGSFHAINEDKTIAEEPTIVNEGEFWTIGGKAGIDTQMRNIKLGQIVGLRYAETKASKTKGFNPLKIIKVFAGAMDEEYQGQTNGDSGPNF
jgi:hypothetical protein